MSSKFLTRLLPITVVLAGLSVPVLAQTAAKVGVVSLQKALQDTAEIKAAEAALKAKFSPRQTELTTLQQEIAKMQQDAEANQNKYNEATMNDLLTRIQSKQRTFERNGQLLQDEVNRERQDILNRVGQRLQEIVKKVAEEKGLDLVVDSNSALYVKPTLDISADVTTAYDKTYPAK